MANCAFTQDEEEIFALRRRGMSIVAISMKMGMSESAVNRRIASIIRKIEDENRYESGSNPP